MKYIKFLVLSLAFSVSCSKTPDEIRQDKIDEEQRIERCRPPGKEVGKTVFVIEEEGRYYMNYSFENGEIWTYNNNRNCWQRIR